jgi:hypothetical protein
MLQKIGEFHTDNGFDRDVGGIDLTGEFSHGLIGILVGVRVNVRARSVGLCEQRRRHYFLTRS